MGSYNTMEESKVSRARVAFVLLCGLAVCCGVMYATADGADEYAMEDVGSGRDTHNPKSIESVDVKKAGYFYTKTPDTLKKGQEGRERLLDFFNKVEDNIAKEVQSRKTDIAAIRAQMEKNMELNASARKKMKSTLMKKMAQNAKIAKDNLNAAMRHTMRQFAHMAAVENARHRADIKRFRKTRAIMRANKREARKALADATTAQQRALAALDQATNAKIRRTNKHIAANAAQMKANAKKARADLDRAMANFDDKIHNAKELAQKGRSKLAADAAAQDKKFRQWAANKVRAATAAAAKQFADVRATMAKDRAHADAALSAASSRMDAALHARKLLQDKRFAQTVSDIAKAKKEADDRVKQFETHFKTNILQLKATAAQQTAQLIKRQNQLAETVQSNKLAQAEVNHKVQAELNRMIKTGEDRYKAHIKHDAELHELMKKNREHTKNAMKQMADAFNGAIDKIKAQAKRDRQHAENRLASKTSALFSTWGANVAAQAKKNKELTDATLQMARDAKRNLAATKASFTRRLSSLDATVQKNMRKVNSDILELTGIEEANAIKSAKGRAQLRAVSAANKRDMQAAVQDAITKGENNALRIEKKMKNVNAATRKSLNAAVQVQISTLRKSIHSQLDEIALESKEARAAMRKEILAAVADASAVAKQNLKKTVEWAEGEFSKLNAKLAAENKKSAAERAAMTKTVAEDKAKAQAAIENAVAAQNAALLAEKQQTSHAIRETNKRLANEGDRMKANARAVEAQMKSNEAAIEASLEAARKASVAQLAAVDAASVARYNKVVQAVKDGVAAATKRSNAKFSQLTIDMANERKRNDQRLAASVATLNDKIAKRSALNDSRFAKTVKDLAAARKAADDEVKQASKEMKVGINNAKAMAKDAETKVQGLLAKVTADIVSDKAAQHIINTKVDAEIKELINKSDAMQTENKKARGVIRQIMNKNKRAAAAYTKALANRADADIKKARGQQARALRQFKKDLTTATGKLYEKMSADSEAQQRAMAGLNEKLNESAAATAASLKAANQLFVSRTDTLTNKISENAKKFERGLSRATGLAMDWMKSSAADRALIRSTRQSMVNNLNKDITRAIEKGEAEMKAVEQQAMENIATSKRALLDNISESIENMADNVFTTIQGNRQKIADNYLSLKAYAATAEDKITDYLQKGKGRNLSSIGDLLNSIAGLKSVKSKNGGGVGFGKKSIKAPFSGKQIPVAQDVSKINGLVNEYIGILGPVKDRWNMGLGAYLIQKLEVAMQGTGALEVDKVSDKAGNFVFINAHAVGLSSKLSDFEGLAVRMSHYEKELSKLTSKLPNLKSSSKKANVNVPPPEWQGN